MARMAKDKPALVKATFDRMQFCPVCGKKLRKFGSASSQYKTCDDQHGLMSAQGEKYGQRLGAFFEIPEK